MVLRNIYYVHPFTKPEIPLTTSGESPVSYSTVTVNLSVAQTSPLQIPLPSGKYFEVSDGSAGAQALVNFDNNPSLIPIYPGYKARISFAKAYIQYEAQKGLTMSFLSSNNPNFGV